MSLYSTLYVACSLLFIFGTRARVFDVSKKYTRERTPSYEKQDTTRQSKWESKYRRSDDYSSKGCGPLDPSFDETTEKFLEHNGIKRSYIVHLPPSYNHGSDEGHPLIVNMHGVGGNSQERMEGSLMNEHADAHDYIAVYPQSTSLGETELFGQPFSYNTWNDLALSASPSPDGPTCSRPLPSVLRELLPEQCQDVHGCNNVNCLADDVGFIDTLLDELESTYCIDRSRIYVTGYSMGGFMTHRLGCELNHRLAAIAPQHGQLALGYNCEPKYDEPMPIINIWGTNDVVVPGEAILDGAIGVYFTPVSHVQYKYGKHNKCEVDEQLPESIASASDGILEWQCIGYNGCNRGDHEYGIDVMSCSWNGTHVYPVSNGETFGLNVIWNFFQSHTKIPPRSNRQRE